MAQRQAALTEASEPSSGQIAWARHLIDVLNDGGIWHVPSTDQAYQIDKTAKTLTLVAGDANDALSWHQNNVILFGKIGYTVLDTAEPPDQVAFAEALELVDYLLDNERP